MKAIIFLLIILAGASGTAAFLYYQPFYCGLLAFFSLGLAFVLMRTAKIEAREWNND